MPLSNKAQVRKIKAMSKEQRVAYFASANRVTVIQVTQVLDNSLKVSYVAKIRGIVIGDKAAQLHETREAAMKYGKDVLAKWKSEFTAANNAVQATRLRSASASA